MSYETYKILHLIGVFSLFLALGALLISTPTRKQKKRIMMLHGIAALLLFITGFGLLARLNILHFLPTWSILKIMLWLVLSLLIPILLSYQFNRSWMWAIVWLCGLFSVLLAVTKMFH